MLFQDFTTENKYHLQLLQSLCGGTRVIDLLLLAPSGYKSLKNEGDALQEGEQIIEVLILSHQPSFKISTKTPYKIIAQTTGGELLTLIFFAGNAGLWKGMFKENNKYLLSCKLSKFGKAFTTQHPKILRKAEVTKLQESGEVITPIYPLTAGLSQNIVQNIISRNIKHIEELENGDLIKAFNNLHSPKSIEDVTFAKSKLAYAEVVAKNIAYFLANMKVEKALSPVINKDDSIWSLPPFELTPDQTKAVEQIVELQSKNIHNTALLQGDVGSGKTIVAILASINAVHSGFQVGIMAPTTILGKQLFYNVSKIAEGLGIETIFFSGEDKGKKREFKLRKIASGEARIVVGTHALFSSAVQFQNLGYIIIDEQHRFGIKQRLELAAKSNGAKVLLMTATPIPRTLSMALYGEIELIYIKAKPKNRKDIITKIFTKEKLPEIIEAVKRKIMANEGVYWVVPFIETAEEEKAQKVSIEERYEEMLKVFNKEDIGVIHGKRNEAEIALEMEKFLKGERKVILATTVIEVGVDAPHASLIIIEEAESFGLSTLHQLRGRVGRSDLQSYCFLVSKTKGEDSLARLKIIANSNDGFYIAEKDMEIRGSASIFSKMQSGFEGFKFMDITEQKEEFVKAKTTSKTLFEQDPTLQTEEGKHLRLLLKIFNYESFLDYIKI